MSDDELSDGMQELNELLAEYHNKEKGKEHSNNEIKNTLVKEENDDVDKSMGVPMDKVIFGDKNKLIENLKKAVTTITVQKHEENIDTKDEQSDVEEDENSNKKTKKRKPLLADADDDELSDGMQELNELIAEYRNKEEEKEHSNDEVNNTLVKEENDVDKSMGVPMDKVIFGDKNKLIENLKKAVTTITVQKHGEIIDTKDEQSDGEEDEKSNKNKKAKKRKPVWADADDEDLQLGEVKKETKRTGALNHLKMNKSYKEHLTARFTRIVNQPKWASLKEPTKKEEDEDYDEELLRTVGFLNKAPQSILSPGHLNIKRVKDLNRDSYGEGYINCIQFHPTSTAALVAGDTGVASIYAVDGTQNDKLHNIHIPNFPIRCAKILPCGTKAIFGSVTRFAYAYDLLTAKETCYKLKKDYGNLSKFAVSPCGRYVVSAGHSGEIHIYEGKSFEMIRTLKQNDNIAALQFTADSQRLIVSGRSSNVCIFSMKQQRLEHKFIDDGCIIGNAMDLSPSQRLLATGSMEGVVNVYDFDKVMQSATPLPEKVLLNLTTAISSVKFNHSSELLAFASNKVKDAVKIARFPSGMVYSNFPGHMPKMDHVRTLEFSPQSAYLALGTTKKCPLFRLGHFKNY